MVSQSFSAARLNQGKFMLRTRSRRNKRSIELAKEGIPLPLGNRFWASNWPTGKAPLTGMIIHFIPAVRLRAGYEELRVLTPIVRRSSSSSLHRRLWHTPSSSISQDTPSRSSISSSWLQVFQSFKPLSELNWGWRFQGLIWLRWYKPNARRPFKGTSTQDLPLGAPHAEWFSLHQSGGLLQQYTSQPLCSVSENTPKISCSPSLHSITYGRPP